MNPRLGMLWHHPSKSTKVFGNFIVCETFKATLREICDPTFEFHLSWKENFIPSRIEWRCASKSTRPQSHHCARLTAHNAATTHLKIKNLILYDRQFLSDQLSCILFVLESLLPFVYLGTHLFEIHEIFLITFYFYSKVSSLPTLGERHEQGKNFCTAFVR